MQAQNQQNIHQHQQQQQNPNQGQQDMFEDQPLDEEDLENMNRFLDPTTHNYTGNDCCDGCIFCCWCCTYIWCFGWYLWLVVFCWSLIQGTMEILDSWMTPFYWMWCMDWYRRRQRRRRERYQYQNDFGRSSMRGYVRLFSGG